LLPRLPGSWRHRVVARRFRGEQPRTLGPGSTHANDFFSDASPASADCWEQSWDGVGDPGQDAYKALQMTYTLFGVDVATNPDVEGDRVITERIQQD